MKACEASLRRLQTDYIDLYQLHRWSIPIEEIDSVIETLDKLVEKGWIRSYGWSTDWYEGAKVFIEKSNCTAIQQGMNVFGYEPRVFELCEQNDLGCICRGPLAMGLLSGKYNHDSKLPIDDVEAIHILGIHSLRMQNRILNTLTNWKL